MNPNEVPTKGNLMRAKNSLTLARQGYDLMDKKRNILIRELTTHIEKAKELQSQIDVTYREAYAALQKANLEMGISTVQRLSRTIELETDISVNTRSIMGTEIPLVRDESPTSTDVKPAYAFYRSRDALDEARRMFLKVRSLTLSLAQYEITAHRLAADIQRTQKRANALKNITIPYYETLVKAISASLEEKEREEFTRMKVIKRQSAKKAESA